jgi:Domain of unknown function (DUF397)
MGVDRDWCRSSYCPTDTQCVEVAVDGPDVLVRDSKNPAGPVLRFSLDEWQVFVRGVLAGEFS